MPEGGKKRDWMIDLRLRIGEKGKTRIEVAQDLHITRDAIRKIECGERTPRHELAVKIAKYYGFHWTKFYENN